MSKRVASKNYALEAHGVLPVRDRGFNNCDRVTNLLLTWRRGDVRVSALDFGSSVPVSSPGWGHWHCVVFLSKTLYSHSAISIQVYKLVPANLMLRKTLLWTSIPSRGK